MTESAIDLLRSLQARAGVSPAQLEQVVQELSEFWGADLHRELAAVKDPIASVEKFWHHFLIQPLLERLPESDRLRLARVTFGLLPTGDPNAWALQVPNGDHLVVMHSELPRAFKIWQEFTEACARSPESLGRYLGTAIVEIMETFRPGFWQGQMPKREYVLDPLIQWKARMSAQGDIQFVLAHEYAHISLGHTGNVTSIPFASGQGDVAGLSWNQEQEVAADVQAARWLIGKNPGMLTASVDAAKRSQEEGNDLNMGWWTFTNWLEGLMLLQLVEAYLGPPSLSSSHPPADVRMRRIATAMSSELSEYEKSKLEKVVGIASELRRVSAEVRPF